MPQFLRNPSTASTDVAFTPRCSFAIATCHKAPLLPLHGNSDFFCCCHVPYRPLVAIARKIQSSKLPGAIMICCYHCTEIMTSLLLPRATGFSNCHCKKDSVFEIANCHKAPICWHCTEILISLPLPAAMVYIIFAIAK